MLNNQAFVWPSLNTGTEHLVFIRVGNKQPTDIDYCLMSSDEDCYTPAEARTFALAILEACDEVEAQPVAAPTPAPKDPHYSNLSPLCQKVYQHMKRAGSISAREAQDDYGITSASLARRICDIEAEGFGITRDRKVHPITEQRYTRYSLAA